MTSPLAGSIAITLLVAAAAPVRGEVAPLAAAPVRIAAPALDLPTVDGARFSLKGRLGRVTLVNFWALWCAPCREEMAALGRLKQAVAGFGIEVVAVNLGDAQTRVRNFLGRVDTGPLTVALDSDSGSAETWHVGGLPVTFLVDADGYISHLALGARDWDAPKAVRWLKNAAAVKSGVYGSAAMPVTARADTESLVLSRRKQN